MFSPKKLKISKKDLKKSIVNANDRLRAANAKMDIDIAAGKDKLKSIENDYNSYKKALEDVKDMHIYANNELNGTQLEISEAQTSIKQALSEISKLSEESNVIIDRNKKLKSKEKSLTKSIALLERKKSDLNSVSSQLKAIKKEEEDGQKTLNLLAVELNELGAGVESYINRKSIAEKEFNIFKDKINKDEATAKVKVKAIEDQVAKMKLSSGQEMGMLDKAIAERMSELQDMDVRFRNKNYELSTVQSKLQYMDEMVKDAEGRIDYIAKQEQEKVNKIKRDFKSWKVDTLDEVARLKIKGKIENIERAGLKEILGG